MRLWAGQFPLARVFWLDMLLVGTSISLVTFGAAFLLFAAGAPTPLGIAVYVAPLPYTIVVVNAVWRSATTASPRWRLLARLASVLWAVGVTLI